MTEFPKFPKVEYLQSVLGILKEIQSIYKAQMPIIRQMWFDQLIDIVSAEIESRKEVVAHLSGVSKPESRDIDSLWEKFKTHYFENPKLEGRTRRASEFLAFCVGYESQAKEALEAFKG